MHGPTFMANPLACAVAVASVELLLSRGLAGEVAAIAAGLRTRSRAGPRRCPASPTSGCSARSASSRSTIPSTCRPPPTPRLEHGVWLRPFRNLVYAMPPLHLHAEEIAQITSAMVAVARATNLNDCSSRRHVHVGSR